MKNTFSKKDKIFLAGSSGMVGKAILRSLKKKGYGIDENIDKLLLPKRKDLDLLDFNSVSNWFEINNPDIVIIAAAKVGGILANSTYPADFLLENLKIQTNLIEAASLFDVKRILFLGST